MWPLAGTFINREVDLASLEEWWQEGPGQPLAMLGRRRVGKSWLFRRFAHQKPALVLVAEQVPAGSLLARFAQSLAPILGVRPDLPDVPTLFSVLYRAARTDRLLVAVDEFPWLLGSLEGEANRILSAILATMEREASTSQLKLLLCGSQLSQMEALFGERNPMHGRLRRMEVRPLGYSGARPFISAPDPVRAFEHYAVAGGMPLYLSRLGSGSLEGVICKQVLDRNGPLWNEGRAVLDQELREPRVYFGILEQLAGGDKELNEIAQPLRMDGSNLTRYLSQLTELSLVSRHVPLGAAAGSRSGHWRLEDPFLRFWFRFVFPYQSDLETGLSPTDLYRSEVAPALPHHVAPVFEDWCRRWLRASRGDVAARVGAWWGPAANQFRRSKERTSEEIDAIGTSGTGRRVTVLSEMKWTNRPMPVAVLDDLERFKIPALTDAGFRVADDRQIVLFSKSGYAPALVTRSEADPRIVLVDVREELDRGTESPRA